MSDEPNGFPEPEDSLETKPSKPLINPDQTIDHPAAESVGPEVSTGHSAPVAGEQGTVRRVGTSVAPGQPISGTETYHPAESFDPDRTGAHIATGKRDDEVEIRVGPSVPGYEILGELGRGGMGVVYKARQIALNRVVAIKMILAGVNAGPSVIARFLTEAQAVARFQHPNLVQVFEIGEFDGMPFFTLAYVEGGTLSTKIAREPQPPKYAAETVEQLARAMQYAHDRGIAHRDLKPANILIAPDGMPKITDFGLAKELEGDSGQTQSGQIMGTPSYMSPEQAEGRLDVGHPADVYALGAILYDLLTGRPPFAGSSVLDTLEMVRTREPVPPGQLTGKLPRDLETVCLKCLQKDVAKRYPSAGALADDLRRFLEGRPIVARPVGKVEQAVRWAKRKPALAGVVSLGIAFVVALMVLVPLLLVAEGRATASAKEANEAKLFAQGKQKEAEDARADEEAAKKKEEEAKKVAIEKGLFASDQRNKAIFTVRDVMSGVDAFMKGRASLAPVRLQILQLMLKRLDEIKVPDELTVIDARTEANGYSRVGQVYFDANRPEDAAKWTGFAHRLLKKLADENPNDQTALLNLSGISHQLADVEWRRGNGPRSRELHAAALKLRQDRTPLMEKLAKDAAPKADGTKYGPADVSIAKFQVADSLTLLAGADLALGDPDSAERNVLAADKAFLELVPGGVVPKGQWRVREKRAVLQDKLGFARLQQGRLDEAEKLFRAALQERESLVIDTPESQNQTPRFRSLVTESRVYLGELLLMARRDADAVVEFAAALDPLAAALARDPENLPIQYAVAALHYRLGYAERKRSGFAAVRGVYGSANHFAECLRMRTALAKIDPTDVPTKMYLMLALARVGKVAEVEAIAKELLEAKVVDQPTKFQVVCGLAVASGSASDAKVATRCRDKAFVVLADLVRDWKARGQLEIDPDLESLRSDPRFAKILGK